MKKIESPTLVLASFLVNLLLFAAKLIIALLSLSVTMFATALHSAANALNQGFLLVGICFSKKRVDELRPFGFSSEHYFWSFIVAIFIFTTGSIFTVYSGMQKLSHPAALTSPSGIIAVLLGSLALELILFQVARKSISIERKQARLFFYLKKSRKYELDVVFKENLAAMAGVLIGLISIVLYYLTANLRFDALGSILIGGLMAGAALLLGMGAKQLLVNESAETRLLHQVYHLVRQDESIHRVIQVKSLQLGQDDVLIAIKAEFNPRLTTTEILNLIVGLEKEIRARHPQVKKMFIDPDQPSKNY